MRGECINVYGFSLAIYVCMFGGVIYNNTKCLCDLIRKGILYLSVTLVMTTSFALYLYRATHQNNLRNIPVSHFLWYILNGAKY